ncbi:aromatic ring-hydroxylating oxygenase subunit alpha [Flavobacterium sp. 3HN19-14]|uniref:aromatic ring-hydroxylating oxygenase subunit alpha n=1 Tax=Flavobacterium sp. 3HN19-14 TaxID=3448133 RepID=UPI003EDEFE39
MNEKNALIPPRLYCDAASQEAEFEKIFSANWFFAAMESDVADNNAFLTLEIFGYPVVIQNFGGKIRAFENICPHRFNKIQTDTKGIRPFSCKYHNWSFDKDGNVRTLPLKSAFDTESDEFKCLKVKSLKIEQVGKFLFISLNENVAPLSEYLGKFYPKLQELSEVFDNNFYFDDDLQQVNWKIIVENVVEAYHCPAIHQETLFGMGFCSIPEANQEYDNGHSVADYPKNEDKPLEKVLKYLENRKLSHETFRHFFIFPNLLISSTEGTTIYVGNILPVAADASVLRKRFFAPAFKENFTPVKAIHNAFLEMAKTSINQILAEDKAVLERIQKNMPFVKATYFLGNEERRISDFHHHYLKIING